ncbi:MAG: flagellar basal body P-ring formation chaperone FlgA [Acetobacter peroxydans]|jgi:flagella basal body P-ring formation protein FlgA|nr:flagellar basal body P-ring formation chaperone FlgA [Acetobacter peroxydans]MCI2007439.1 flagellar basal body P-ring formation chaperone FlgA [Acetobacter peroxydans]MCI2077859.1 flagellar basal body P-ring formation chaperone FlgA [Acetobacter peroxydans]
MGIRGGIAALIVAGSMVYSVPPTEAATLKTASVITASTVRLSDLFSDLEPGQDRVLGPAPAPGTSIQVGGAQLLAIADQYGVDWLDQSASAQVTITRAGRVLDKDYFINLVRQNLPDAGSGPVSVDLIDFHPIAVSPDDPKPVTLSDLNWDPRSGRFTATIYRTQTTGDATQDSYLLAGTVHAARRVLVFSHALQAGSVISMADVTMDEAYTGRAQDRTYTDEADIDGMTLTHSVMAGDAVQERDLHRTVVVHKGDPVLIVFTAPGLHLTASGRAIEDGGKGQYVRVLNLASNMIVTGRPNNASEVVVEAGSSGMPSDAATLRRLTTSSRGG